MRVERIAFSMPFKSHQEMMRIAEKKGVNLSFIYERVLNQYIEKQKKKHPDWFKLEVERIIL